MAVRQAPPERMVDRDPSWRCLLVVALGTRGDVQPILALARVLRLHFDEILFCTHEALLSPTLTTLGL